MTLKRSQVFLNYEPKRDTYGFTVRPQHLHRYREYTDIYREEEEERLQKWRDFLKQLPQTTSAQDPDQDSNKLVVSVVTKLPYEPAHTQSLDEERKDLTEERLGGYEAQQTEPGEGLSGEGNDSSEKRSISCTQEESVGTNEAPTTRHPKSCDVQTWSNINPSLSSIEQMTNIRIKKRKNIKDKSIKSHDKLPSIAEPRFSREDSEDNEDDVFYDNEIVEDSPNASEVNSIAIDKISVEPFFPWKEELEFLVRGGVPKDLRGEVWQAFVGVRTRRVERYYQDLLANDIEANADQEHNKFLSGDDNTQRNGQRFDSPDKWKKQIEKDLPRTFPGHPALNEKGRNSLRRVLSAYARHNPSVGYCQAMNFFAGLLLLMMPEENAFWTLVGLMDDYFEDYFSQEMIESQVDQLVFEDLMREKFPKLVNHLDYLGVQVAWISGPWFLSIFVNMLPWESVLRVWDVLLFEGNRVMLFRTALALMDLYGPAVVTTKDAGDAITLLQTLTGSTFDSSQLVLTACMGFLTVTEDRLQELREKHRPAILSAVEERTKGSRIFKDPKGLATKLYSFKHNPELIVKESKRPSANTVVGEMSDLESHARNLDAFLKSITIDSEIDSLPDHQEQVVWLKAELCRLLEEKRTAMLRAEELEAALMEMVKQDNRRELSARVEQLEQEVAELRRALADKKEEEQAMLQVLMKVEQEQKVTEDARLFAEQDSAAQKYAVHVLQEKYETTMNTLAEMERRAVMAESMLEATLQYESGQSKASSSPRLSRTESPHDVSTRKTGLLPFGLGWRDRNKGKPSNAVAPAENKTRDEGTDSSNADDHANVHQ
ncbi:uncharacterized protein LOC142546347 [Primulina tabacum]|uniref:uncharacterized protein LOC142546347 n=1 Tax=Primulina tabacum TaxID=48773 RepID=UPI003F599792